MKMVIDLQSLQTDSAFRGIGRYSLSLTREMLRTRNDIEFTLLFNDQADINASKSVIEELRGAVGEDSLVYFPAPENLNYLTSPPIIRRVAELVRERFIEALNPDVLLLSSLFEFDAVTSVQPQNKRSYLTTVILYDLIPLAQKKHHLPNAHLKRWHSNKIEHLKNSDLVLSISQYSLDDAVQKIGLDHKACINISGASDLADYQNKDEGYLGKQLADIPQHYILYVGGFDQRKNVAKLIKAFSKQPPEILSKYSLVLAGKIGGIAQRNLKELSKKYLLPANKVIFPGYINDDLLIHLYKNCSVFVFPSSNEGFGLPPLEAMGFGAPVIAANKASLPEVIGEKEFLFDPDGPDFPEILTRALTNSTFREALINNSKKQFRKFSWEKVSNKALNFLEENIGKLNSLAKKRSKTNDEFLEDIAAICKEDMQIIQASKLCAKLFAQTKKMTQRKEFVMISTFHDAVPDFSKVDVPYVFSSGICREQHFHLPLYTYWCRCLAETPKFHRKQWEFVYICHALYERGYIQDGHSGIGFGVGKEPLVSYFASQGVNILATDLDLDRASKLGWASSNQHSNDIFQLNERSLCEQSKFLKKAKFLNVDMNDIPSDLGKFDFCWSSCAFEHLGSIENGLNFVLNSSKLLKPGGIAIHTTEFNLSSNTKTLDNNPSFVIFRRRDIEQLVRELTEKGYEVEPIDFSPGEDELERYVDMPPYIDEPHLRLELAGKYISTSLGIIIQAPLN